MRRSRTILCVVTTIPLWMVGQGSARATHVSTGFTREPCQSIGLRAPIRQETVYAPGREKRVPFPSGGLRDISPGDIVRLQADGKVHGGGFGGWVGWWDPDGKNEPAIGWEWTARGERKWSLVGGFNDSTQPYTFIGKGPTCFAWHGAFNAGRAHPSLRDDTYLWLAFNDDNNDDNRGSFKVTGQIWRCAPSNSC